MNIESTVVPGRKVPSKGTKTTEIILGVAASRLETGIKSLSGVLIEVAKLDEKINENSLIISDLEAKIEAKEQELKNSIAQKKIDLQQAYDSNREAFVKTWLLEKGFEIISSTDLTQLKADLASSKTATDAEVRKEVAIVTHRLTAAHESAKKEYELEYKVKEAQNLAALAQKDEKIKFLEEQVSAWTKALDNERDAGIKRAQAGSIQTLNVGTGNGR